jgi:anti-anti-sigma regulatory factor
MLKCTDDVTSLLDSALMRVDGSEAEIVLDFSAVRRIGPGPVRALEGLAARADEKGKQVVLGGVSVEVYRVLKLAHRFGFLG